MDSSFCQCNNIEMNNKLKKNMIVKTISVALNASDICLKKKTTSTRRIRQV